MPHFLFQLLPPRPTFAQDMNDEERKLMHEHAEYLQQLQERGLVPVYGPVFDPKGAWGMAVFEVADENEVKELMSNDPTIKSSLHHYEIHPMRAIIKLQASSSKPQK